MDWNYKVILVGGERDGEVLCYTISYMAAVNYCNVYYRDHLSGLHTVWGGLMIFDKDDNYIQW